MADRIIVRSIIGDRRFDQLGMLEFVEQGTVPDNQCSFIDLLS